MEFERFGIWNLKDLLDNLQKWFLRNKPMASGSRHNEEPSKKERNWYAGKGSVGRQKGPKCVFWKDEHYSDSCETVKDINSRRKFFAANKLFYNCGQPGHQASNCHGGVVSNVKENTIQAHAKGNLGLS